MAFSSSDVLIEFAEAGRWRQDGMTVEAWVVAYAERQKVLQQDRNKESWAVTRLSRDALRANRERVAEHYEKRKQTPEGIEKLRAKWRAAYMRRMQRSSPV